MPDHCAKELVEHLSSILEALFSILSTAQTLGLVVHDCNSSMQEVGQENQEFKASLHNILSLSPIYNWLLQSGSRTETKKTGGGLVSCTASSMCLACVFKAVLTGFSVT